jgi:hypothetical protein
MTNIIPNLAHLAAQINAEHAAVVTAARTCLEHAKRAGELLAQAKEHCDHGNWLPWLRANVEFSERTAQGYLQVAQHWDELQANPQPVADLTLRGALDLLAVPRASPLEKRRELNRQAEEDIPGSLRGVLTAGERWFVTQSDALDFLVALERDAAQLILFSPPYENARSYDGLPPLVGEAWVARYVAVIHEALRIAPLVCCVCDGRTEGYSWSGVPHLLEADLLRSGVTFRHDLFYRRVGIPGSGGPDWLKNDCEYVLCATRGGPLPWSVNTAMGHPPKFKPGGKPSHRKPDGTRVNQGYASPEERQQHGPHRARQRAGRVYQPPPIANPGNVIQQTYTAEEMARLLEPAGNFIDCKVGGGNMGNDLCHENEAPFAEHLAESIIKSFCPPNGIVCDPFCGSGTTLAVAVRSGRRAIGCDIRPSQVELTRRVLEGQTAAIA